MGSYGTCCDGLVCEGLVFLVSYCEKPRKSRSLLETPSKCAKEGEYCGEYPSKNISCCDGFTCPTRPSGKCRKQRKSNWWNHQKLKIALELGPSVVDMFMPNGYEKQ